MDSATHRTRLWQRINLWAPLILALVAYGVAAKLLLQRLEFVGDEPHYLLIAHSLCYDHDIDLKNNYEAQDYLSFYPYPTLDLHAYDYRGDGTLRPLHYVGLPVVLTLPYCLLGQTHWTRLEMAILAALASWSIFLLVRNWTNREDVAWFTWAAVTFSSPLWTMAPQLYPDVVAVLGVAMALLLLNSPSLSTCKIAALSIIVAGLPWLQFRLATLSLLIILTTMVRLLRSRAHWRQGVLLLALPALSGSLWLWSSYAWYGSLLPTAMLSPLAYHFKEFSWRRWYVAAVDLGLGRENGMLTYAPVYWIALVGLVTMALRREKAIWVPGLGLIAYVFIVSLSAATYQTGLGYAFPVRFLLPIVPLLVIPFAYAILHDRWLRIVGIPLFLVSVVISAQSLVHPDQALANGSGVSKLALLKQLQVVYPSLQSERRVDLDLSKMFRETGQVVSDEAKSRAIHAQPGVDEPGSMAFGPYQALPTGQYTATFILNADRVDPSASVAYIDVATDLGKRVLAQRDIYARDFATKRGYQSFDLSFSTRDIWELEYRVYFTGQAGLWLQAIHIEPRAPTPSPAYPGLPIVAAWSASVIVGGIVAARRKRNTLPTEIQAS